MSTYRELGAPQVKWFSEAGWAHFANGYRAWLSRWDEYERGLIDDFPCYAPTPKDKLNAQLEAWLANPTATIQPSAPPPDERSRELGRMAIQQALCHYRPAELERAAEPRKYNPNRGDGYGID